MSITVVKEGDILRLLDSSAVIPDGSRLVLYTADELKIIPPPSLDAWEAAQLETVFREDDEDWGDSLDDLVARDSD